MTLVKYKEFQPTIFDHSIPLGEGRDDWLVFPRTLVVNQATWADRYQWRRARSALLRMDPSGNDHEEHRFKHWCVGNFDMFILKPGSKCAKYAERRGKRQERDRGRRR